MKKLRKAKPGKRKRARAEAEKKLTRQAGLLLDHPMECCLCHTAFNRDKQTVKTWMVTASEEKETVHLTCPDCWVIVEKVVEEGS